MQQSRQQTDGKLPYARWPLLLLGLSLTLPALNKPFHVDDPDYLRIARHIRRHPFDPYGFELLRGGRWFAAGAVHPSPPLFCYGLAAVTALVGERELPLHVFGSLFVVWGVFLAARLGWRIADAPYAAAVLIVASPMLLPGQNVMLDVPMLVLLLAAVNVQLSAIAAATSGARAAANTPSLLSGLLLAAAVLTKYPALLVAPAMALHWYLTIRRVPLRWLAGFLIPVAAWLLFSWLRYQPTPALQRALDPPTLGRLVDNTVSILMILGATCLATPLALPMSRRDKAGWITIVSAVAVGAACVAHRLALPGAAPAAPLELVLRGLFAAAATALLVSTARAIARHVSTTTGHAPLLTAWLAFSLSFNLVVQSTTVRHVLLCLPPVVLLLLRAYSGRTTCLRISCILSLLLALGLADADARFARSTKGLVDQLAHRAGPNTTVYVAGEWALGYYAQRAGLIPLHERVVLGSAPALLAVPEVTYRVGADQLPREWHVRMSGAGPSESLSPAEPRFNKPLRTIARGVNFYDVGTRNLPWSVSTEPPERITLYPIRAAAR